MGRSPSSRRPQMRRQRARISDSYLTLLLGLWFATRGCMSAQPNADPASFWLTRNGTSSGRCQTRGGRKGGVPGRERYELLASEGPMLEMRTGNRKGEVEAVE